MVGNPYLAPGIVNFSLLRVTFLFREIYHAIGEMVVGYIGGRVGFGRRESSPAY